jgi:hypothetical protein
MKTPTQVMVVALLLHGFLPWALAHDEPAEEMTEAAKNFLASLSSEQKAKATFELTNDERQNWHFIPKPRKGLPFKEMAPPSCWESLVAWKSWFQAGLATFRTSPRVRRLAGLDSFVQQASHRADNQG